MNTTDKSETEEKIIALSRKVSAYRGQGEGGARQLPPELREEILEVWRDSGLPKKHLGQRVGISGNSIANWAKASPKKRSVAKLRTQVTKKRTFKQVRVVPEAPLTKGKAERAFELELASGARVRGLRMADLLELMAEGGVR
jgi:hypothetical protein